MARGPGKGALAALGLAGLFWAYKNRDKIGAKVNEYRGQIQEQAGNRFDQPSSSNSNEYPSQPTFGEKLDPQI